MSCWVVTLFSELSENRSNGASGTCPYDGEAGVGRVGDPKNWRVCPHRYCFPMEEIGIFLIIKGIKRIKMVKII